MDYLISRRPLIDEIKKCKVIIGAGVASQHWIVIVHFDIYTET